MGPSKNRFRRPWKKNVSHEISSHFAKPCEPRAESLLQLVIAINQLGGKALSSEGQQGAGGGLLDRSPAMYISYGWPVVLETTTAEGPSTSDSKAKDLDDSEEVAWVCSVGKATAIGKQNEVQVWTRTKQGRVRVGRFRAKDDDVMVEGGFRYAAWEPKQRALVVCTSGGVVYVLSLSEDARRDATGGSCPGSRFPAVDVGVRARFDCSGVLPTALLVDEKTILLGCADGALVSYNWDGYQKSKLSLLPPGEDLDAHEPWLNNQSVQTLQYCRSRRTLLILLKNGMCALYMFSSDGLRLKSSSSSFCWVLAPRSETITAASLSPESHTLALGTQCGAVHLYAIGNDLSQHKLRTLSLAEWGHTGQSSGVVESVRWAADGRAMAIVWEKAGLSVWTASGCRLMYHLEGHTGQKKEATAAAAGRRAVCWSPEGLQLVASSRRDPSRVLLFSFARAALNSSPTRSGTNQSSLLSVPSACLLGDDRVLCVFGSDVLGDAERPTLHHLPLPQQYSGLNWPARLIAVSARGEDLAVAGERGAALYSHRHRRWRLFGDVNQESAIRCLSLTWVDEVVMLCCQPCSSRPALLEDSSPQGQVQLRFYPKYHLDSTSLLCQKRLNAPPRAMSAQGDRLVVLSGDAGKLEAAVLRLIVEGPLGPSQRPIARVEVLREVCIVTMRPPPVLTSFVPALGGGDAGRGPRSACLVLHADGQLCHLDLETGSERGVLDKVEHFWCEAEPEGGRDGGSGDGSLLWTYGARGISILDVGRVLSLVREGKMARLEVQEPDPELEFDREVYPLGLNPGVNSIVGISQHSANLASSASHGFSPLPKAQPLLSPLLRYLLTQGRQEDAERLVQRSARHPHFSHSLEWLVFTVLEKEYSSADAVHAAAKPRGLYNLSTVLGLVQRLKVYADVIVRVARKIDPVHWGLLFQEAGQPTRLFEKSLQVGCCPRHRKKKRLLTNVLLTPPPQTSALFVLPSDQTAVKGVRNRRRLLGDRGDPGGPRLGPGVRLEPPAGDLAGGGVRPDWGAGEISGEVREGHEGERRGPGRRGGRWVLVRHDLWLPHPALLGQPKGGPPQQGGPQVPVCPCRRAHRLQEAPGPGHICSQVRL